MKFNITQEDIDQGIRRNAGKCPVARAIGRKTHANLIRVLPNSVYYDSSPVFRTSRRLRKFINDLDMGKNVKPMSFILKKEIT